MRTHFKFRHSQSLIAVVTTVIGLLFLAPVQSFADSANRVKLDECVPSEADPCANIVDHKVETTLKGRKIERPMSVTQSKATVKSTERGIDPEAAPNAFRSGNSVDKSKAALTAVTMRVVVNNYSRYNAYWRLGTVRGSVPVYWPSPTRYFTVKKLSTASVNVRCFQGETLLWGAGTTNGVYYWGVGEDFDQTCTGPYCANTCRKGQITIDMR